MVEEAGWRGSRNMPEGGYVDDNTTSQMHARSRSSDTEAKPGGEHDGRAELHEHLPNPNFGHLGRERGGATALTELSNSRHDSTPEAGGTLTVFIINNDGGYQWKETRNLP